MRAHRMPVSAPGGSNAASLTLRQRHSLKSRLSRMSGPLLWPSQSDSGMTTPISRRSFSRRSRQELAASRSWLRVSRLAVLARTLAADKAKLTATTGLLPPEHHALGVAGKACGGDGAESAARRLVLGRILT